MTAPSPYGRVGSVSRNEETGVIMNATDGAYCIRCQREGLPLGMLCDRDVITDHGADRDPDLESRYEGRCLRCCEHNHG